MVASRNANVIRHSRGSYKEVPIAVSGVAKPKNKYILLALSFMNKEFGERLSYECSFEGCYLPLIRLTEHLAAIAGSSNICIVGDTPTCSLSIY